MKKVIILVVSTIFILTVLFFCFFKIEKKEIDVKVVSYHIPDGFGQTTTMLQNLETNKRFEAIGLLGDVGDEFVYDKYVLKRRIK